MKNVVKPMPPKEEFEGLPVKKCKIPASPAIKCVDLNQGHRYKSANKNKASFTWLPSDKSNVPVAYGNKYNNLNNESATINSLVLEDTCSRFYRRNKDYCSVPAAQL